jgi:hypothetical protein
MILTMILFLLALKLVHAEEHVHTHEGVVGKFYQSWKIPPKREVSCCDEKDCYQTRFKTEGGTVFFLHRETGTWMVIPSDKLEENTADPRDSPDGLNHVCANAWGVVFCAVRGGGM